MFKNLMVYRLSKSFSVSLSQLEQGLAGQRFVECSATQEKSLGWIEPRGQAHGPLAESVGGQWILKLMLETKSVPASVINRKLQTRVEQIEATEGRKAGKKERRDMKDELRFQLLPMAFTKQSSIWVWIDLKAKLLVLDAGSPAKADDAMTLLTQCVPGLEVKPLDTRTSPAVAMAQWLISQEPPAGLTVDRECELKAPDESRAVVRYARHPLDIDEVRSHIESGKQPTRLALTWDSRVSFVLTDALMLKKLAFLDVVFEGPAGKQDEGFDTDVAIATGELQRLLPDLVLALGGEA